MIIATGVTDEQIERMCQSGRSSYEFESVKDFDRATVIIEKTMKDFMAENPGKAKFWPLFHYGPPKEKTHDEEVYERGLELIASFYQKKRAHLKKQVTHWYGKFMIVKAENNKLRAINKKTTKLNDRYTEALGKQDKEAEGLKSEIAKLNRALYNANMAVHV